MSRGGGRGGPFLPQLATRRDAARATAVAPWMVRVRRMSEHVAAQILVLDDTGESAADVARVDVEMHAGHARRLERDLLEHPFGDGGEPARPDVLGARVDLDRDTSELAHRVVGELDRETLGREQLAVLARERALGLGEDAHEVLFGQRVELDA